MNNLYSELSHKNHVLRSYSEKSELLSMVSFLWQGVSEHNNAILE